ncbi:MAG: hypothetical protein JWN74_3276, partial [Acidobacteriaceae bacterium]|nr:hypothetical protein [Acidobacteriaceae bacterium]
QVTLDRYAINDFFPAVYAAIHS